MADTSTGQTRIFTFTAPEGNWRELLRQLNEFAKMVQTDLQTDQLTTKTIQLVPIKGPVYRDDAKPGMMFLRQREFDAESSVMLALVQPSAATDKILKGLGAVTFAVDANGESVAGGLQP